MSANSLASAMLTARKVFSHQLGHFGGGERAHVVHAAGVAMQQLVGALLALGGGASDDAGDGLLVDLVVAGVDALGAEGHEDVVADHETAVFERLHDEVLGASHVGGGGEHDQLAGNRVRDDRLAGRRENPQVGGEVLVDRGGHADHDGGGT